MITTTSRLWTKCQFTMRKTLKAPPARGKNSTRQNPINSIIAAPGRSYADNSVASLCYVRKIKKILLDKIEKNCYAIDICLICVPHLAVSSSTTTIQYTMYKCNSCIFNPPCILCNYINKYQHYNIHDKTVRKSRKLKTSFNRKKDLL